MENKPTDLVTFYPLRAQELNAVMQANVNPQHTDYVCGPCGQTTNGRVIARMQRKCDGATIAWGVCSCEREEPVVLIERSGKVTSQIPDAQEFQPGENWPPDLAQLFDEAGKAFAAGAYTAAVMVARKVLMVCACHEGDTDGKRFVEYVDHITNRVLTYAKAKASIDKIRDIGNEANHSVRMVSRDDAKRALSIVNYMLNAIYSLPSA